MNVNKKPGEAWLDDTSPTTDPPQADLQNCFERGANGFQIGSRNSFRTAMPNHENSIRAKNLDTGLQSDGCYPPTTSGTNK